MRGLTLAIIRIMRTQITIIIILFFPFFLIAQQSIDGCFCNSLMGEFNKEVEAECVKFHSNNTFSYEYSFFEYEYGFGKYFFKEDSLILQFDSWQKQINKLQIIDSSATNDDSISIEIRFRLEQTERIDIIGIIMTPYTLSGDEKHLIKGNSIIYTDSLIIIKIEKQSKEIYLEIRAIGIAPTVFKINGARSIKGICYLHDGYYGRINGKNYRYKIVKKNFRELFLQAPDFEGNDFIRIFKKKK